MVFKPINLARQGLVKTFTHGYAQSLVAASQSSSASSNTFFSFQNNVSSIYGKAGPPTIIQQTIPNSANSTGSGADAGTGSNHPGYAHTDVSGGDVPLAAYYAAWQKHQKNDEKDNETYQFQFAKRVGWKAPTTVPEALSHPKAHVQTARPRPSRAILARTRSASVLEGLRKVGEQDNQVEISQPVLAIEESASTTAASMADQEEVSAEVLTLASESIARATSPHSSLSEDSNHLWTDTDATSVSDADHFTEQLTHLAETQQYVGVPPTFEAMLHAGVKPTTSAYNALLLAAINIARGKHQVVPKVLDVYQDMLRRKVSPDTATYGILIELLAARAMDVTAMKKELVQRRVRFGGMEAKSSFLFRSDATELAILSEDDSLSLAIKLFDTSAAIATKHVFSAETYRLLISACAEQSRIGDMVRIYADMESQSIPAPTSTFAPMIQAFASIGDLKSAVDCYNEYKALAILHDSGDTSIVRKDEDVYAAVVNAYIMCGRIKDGLKFYGRIQDALARSPIMLNVQDVVGVQAIIPQMLAEGRHLEALTYAADNLTPTARQQAVASICSDAADKNITRDASEAFNMLTNTHDAEARSSAVSMLAMHIRAADVTTARAFWSNFLQSEPIPAYIEPTAMYALSLIVSGSDELSLLDTKDMFNRIRGSSSNKQSRLELVERIDEAIELMGKQMSNPICSPAARMTLIQMMLENGGLTPVAENVLATFGPAELSVLSTPELSIIAQIEAEMITGTASLDIGHAARFTHIVDMMMSANVAIEGSLRSYILKALDKLQRHDIIVRLQNDVQLLSPITQHGTIYSPVSVSATIVSGENYDPYSSSTDFKGSAFIAEELEKSHGRFAAHLNEAMAKIKSMRRSGRHPRYTTYAKLISAAAKESNLDLANEILIMARTDIPLITGNAIVRQGWVAIYDAMVAAALTLNKRDLATRFHAELLSLGAAPSANTYGLYITTLATTSKPLDEATLALDIFQRAQREGVQPSSFLYNALIGKLGKARRIDDCLFHFAAMRAAGIRPTSVTYGTIVNALCRVSDDKFAEELFEEMEAMPNYKPRPAPYNSLMQYFLTTKGDRSKVLSYYERMCRKGIKPTMHTYKLLIDAHASLEPVDMPAAESVLMQIENECMQPEAVHYASLIHAKGCTLRDLPAATAVFDDVVQGRKCAPAAPLWQALFESVVANHAVSSNVVDPLLQKMKNNRIGMTAYIANTLIHGWASTTPSNEGLRKARTVYEELGREKREPSTYEAMTRAYLAAGEEGLARGVVGEAMKRGYPSAVVGKIKDLIGVESVVVGADSMAVVM
jgi:pentatricopeptide repeat protein